jgi:hypothetical protein
MFAVQIAVVAATLSACTAASDTAEPTGASPSDLTASANDSDRTPAPFGPPFTLNKNRCGFPIYVQSVNPDQGKEFQEVTTLSDGTTITKITGKLFLSFTNLDNGVTIVRNVSGPETITARLDGTGTQVDEGESWFGFGPVSQGNTGEPGLVFTSGRVVLEFAGHFVTTFTLSGTQIDGCTLLSQ